jgi:oxygen-independent coproporphyrinogen-3 oxidase
MDWRLHQSVILEMRKSKNLDGILILMDPYSLYIHFPFCQNRCSYCDFNTNTGRLSLIPLYSNRVIDEIKYFGTHCDYEIPLHSIFFGGGTPSLLPADLLSSIIASIQDLFSILPHLELTIEANPGTVSREYLENIRSIGVNRISLGMQSASPQELLLLGREHVNQDVLNAVYLSRLAGFDNINLDLIFGLPGQELLAWEKTMQAALMLEPDHLSLYSLTIEVDTPLYKWASRGLLPQINHDVAAEMYELASDLLSQAGYIHYEISNWARGEKTIHTKKHTLVYSTTEIKFACRHNLQYWRNLPYLGFGAGAHGFVGGYRTINIRSLNDYISRISINKSDSEFKFPQTPATSELVPIDQESEIQETMIMGLRLIQEGVSDVTFQKRFGMSMMDIFEKEINKLEKFELVEWVENRLRLTQKGYLLANQVFIEFL